MLELFLFKLLYLFISVSCDELMTEDDFCDDSFDYSFNIYLSFSDPTTGGLIFLNEISEESVIAFFCVRLDLFSSLISYVSLKSFDCFGGFIGLD